MSDVGLLGRGLQPVGLFLLVCAMLLSNGTAEAALPAGRVYEQVTPTLKNGADVIANASRTRASDSGDAMEFASLTGFGDPPGMAVSADYIAVRDAHGEWLTHGVTPAQDPTTIFELSQFALEPRYVGNFSSDLSRGVFLAKTPLTTAPNVSSAVNLYLRSDLLSAGPGAYQLLSDATTPQVAHPTGPLDAAQPYVAAASEDFSRILFESTRNLTADAVGAGLSEAAPKLYLWVAGTLRLAGILPLAEGGSATVSQAGQQAQRNYATTTLSQDGRRVQFTGPPFSGDHSGGVLYLRDDQATLAMGDDTTVRVSASERTDCNDDPTCGGNGVPDPAPDPANPGGIAPPATFWAASSDGAQVFFATAEQLTDDDINSSTDLYKFDLNSSPAHLTRLSVDHEASDNGGNDLHSGHDVSGVLGASSDGAYVYFSVFQGQLVAGGPTGSTGGPNGGERIFLWHAGQVRQVGAVNNGPEYDRIVGRSGWSALPKWSRVSPDGRHAVFVTQGTDELLALFGQANYDHGDTCPSFTNVECLEVYVYSAEANGGNGGLQCASCNPTGAKGITDADFYATNTTGGGSRFTSRLNRVLSDNGRFVFFNSGDRLAPDDVNSSIDAYVYDTTTQQVDLISQGSGPGDSIFLDASSDGHNAFFTTRDRLRSTDQDQSRDLYNARIGGNPDLGLPQLVPCAGDNCRPAATVVPGPIAPPSVEANGANDISETDNIRPVFVVKPMTSRQRKALIQRGRGQLTAVATHAGRLVIRVSARIRDANRTVHVVSRLVPQGQVRIPLHLTQVWRKRLARRGFLRLTIKASYSHVADPQQLTLILRNNNV